MAKQKSKHNNEEPKFNFDPLPNHKDSLASEIKEKVEDAKNQNLIGRLPLWAIFQLFLLYAST